MNTKKRKQTQQESGIKIHFSISPSKVSGFFAMHISKRTIKGAMRGAEKFALILLVFPLLDRPAVVIPKNFFVVIPGTTQHIMLNIDRQFDKVLVSGIYSGLKYIGHSKALSLETV